MNWIFTNNLYKYTVNVYYFGNVMCNFVDVTGQKLSMTFNITLLYYNIYTPNIFMY